ncbi:MAG: HAMP domain-containing histidine kinase [Candidatus Heimdallarchaeota archaeon]|nr:HAMP domain-containing histidine kinase [Candidatus Heimdallarchaeota archaeon]
MFHQMVSGLAHEINNPLMIIQNYLSLLTDDVEQGKPIQISCESEYYDNLLEIAEQCRRIAKLTKNLQDFSRTSSSPPRNHDLHQIISSAINLLEPSIVQSQIQLKWDALEDLCQCFVKYTEMEKVFLHILNNAIYALNQKYHGKRSPQENEIAIHIYHETRVYAGKSKPFLVVSVRDDGIGILEKNKERIFDPFFSTKKTKLDVPEFDKSQGMGLGLAKCRSILTQHEGFISFESERNLFTEFLIYLPCASEKEKEDVDDDEVVF